jgi:hypothetical protein
VTLSQNNPFIIMKGVYTSPLIHYVDFIVDFQYAAPSLLPVIRGNDHACC